MSSVTVSPTRAQPVRVGQRSNVSGVVCTIFGSTGRLGAYVCDRLGSMGCMLILPYRDDGISVRANKVSGDPGQIAPVPVDLFDIEKVERSMENSNVAINMIGAFKATRHFSLHDANVKTAYRIAKAAKEQGVERFVHISALGASSASKSDFLKAKAESEDVVKHFFPRATIVRPAPMYCLDSEWINDIAMKVIGKRWVPTVENHGTPIQPVSMKDVAVAIQQVIAHPEIDGNTWELVGAEVLTRGQIVDVVRKMIVPRQWPTVPYLNEQQSKLWGQVNDLIPFESLRLYSKDQADYQAIPMVASRGQNVPGLADLGITPANFTLGLLQAVKPFMSEEAPARQAADRSIFSWRPY